MAQAYTVVFDRVEEERAVLVFDQEGMGQVLVPRKLLQGLAREGDVLRITIEKDEESTAARRKKVAGLLKELLNGG